MASLYSPTHAGISRLQWNKCDTPALENMSSPIDAAVYNDTAYFRPYRSKRIYSYNLTSGWSDWADCLVRDCSLVVLPVPYKGTDQLFLLHTIGGIKRKNHQQNDDEEEDEEEFTADIYQLTNYAPGEWTPSIYPPLTTKRSQVTVVLDNDYLIVAGGYSAYGIIQTVDVLYLGNEEVEWHEVASLRYKVFRASGCVCNDTLYILGGYVVREGDIVPTRNACVATVSQLVKSHSDNRKIFKTIKKMEFKTSACVSFCNHVLAIGGWKFNMETGQQKGTNLVHVYHTGKKIWKKLEGHLPRPRCLGFAAAFEDKIMTVGGYNRPNGICTDSVAFATIPSDDDPEQVCQAPLPSEREAGIQEALKHRKMDKGKGRVSSRDKSQSSSRKRPAPGIRMSDDQQPAPKKQKLSRLVKKTNQRGKSHQRERNPATISATLPDPQVSHQRKLRSSLASDVHGSSPKKYRSKNQTSATSSNPIVLTEEDIAIICERLKNARKDWFNLGLVFGVKIADLTEIEDENRRIIRRLTEMVRKRLEVPDPEHPMTWSYICECLRKPTVERNDVAEKIERCMRS